MYTVLPVTCLEANDTKVVVDGSHENKKSLEANDIAVVVGGSHGNISRPSRACQPVGQQLQHHFKGFRRTPFCKRGIRKWVGDSHF